VTKRRIWSERIGLAALVGLALGLPCLLGLAYYLALNPEGITVNGGDPQRLGRLWMTRERRPTGIALQTTEPALGSEAGATCARTTFTYLNWENRLSLTREPQTCQCLTGARAVCQ
jgi:hypothetical protein